MYVMHFDQIYPLYYSFLCPLSLSLYNWSLYYGLGNGLQNSNSLAFIKAFFEAQYIVNVSENFICSQNEFVFSIWHKFLLIMLLEFSIYYLLSISSITF
jgi:hypothetical protein